jgi:hypothetical protein
VGCPLDEAMWKSGLADRLNEILAADPGITRVLVDLELYSAGRHHYDAGPCRCASCRDAFPEARAADGGAAGEAALVRAQEDRLVSFLTPMCSAFAAAHPGVEIGVFDLDFPSFVHRALARALVAAKVPAADYTERTYREGAARAGEAKAALDSLGVRGPLVTGLLLKRILPANLTAMAKDAVARTDGYFIFTTYSLWQTAEKLTSDYTLPAPAAEYWPALSAANR